MRPIEESRHLALETVGAVRQYITILPDYSVISMFCFNVYYCIIVAVYVYYCIIVAMILIKSHFVTLTLFCRSYITCGEFTSQPVLYITLHTILYNCRFFFLGVRYSILLFVTFNMESDTAIYCHSIQHLLCIVGSFAIFCIILGIVIFFFAALVLFFRLCAIARILNLVQNLFRGGGLLL